MTPEQVQEAARTLERMRALEDWRLGAIREATAAHPGEVVVQWGKHNQHIFRDEGKIREAMSLVAEDLRHQIQDMRNALSAIGVDLEPEETP